MTYLNRTYSCKARFYADSDVEHTKVWYWCEPGAAEFPDYSLHGAQVFMDRQVPPANWKYPGEVPYTLKINKGANPHNSPGIKGCQIGETNWFVSGIPSGKTIDDVVIPPCCRRPVALLRGNTAPGYPDIFMTDPSWFAGKFAMFFAIFTDVGAEEPTPPAGWDVHLSQLIPGSRTWAMICSIITPDPAPSSFLVDGGSAFDSYLGMAYSHFSAPEFTLTESAPSSGLATVQMPQPFNSESGQIMLFASFTSLAVSPTVYPVDMELLQPVTQAHGGVYQWQQPGIGAGILPARAAEYGTPVTALAWVGLLG